MPILSSAAQDTVLALIDKLIAKFGTYLSTNLRSQLLLKLGGFALAIVFILRRAYKKTTGNSGRKGRNTQGYITSLKEVNDKEYDLIIVGGGTSGCALAARVSEIPSIKVLLLEAGGSGTALTVSSTPSMYGRTFLDPLLTYPLRTEPQVAAGDRTNLWPRAKMLGGCSSINAQMAQYGAAGDFDQWASYTGDESWAWKNVSHYFTKFENYQPHSEYPDVNITNRGTSGPVKIGYFNTVSEISKKFIKACVNVGIPYTAEFNGKSGGTMGVGRIRLKVTYVDSNFKRVSSESAYLTPDVLARDNLDVVINATVTKVLFDSSTSDIKDSEPRVAGVQFGRSEGGPLFTANAKEVVVSGGAVHSPHILMLSGIGPADHLRSKGISVIVDSPGVGSRLIDHPSVDLYFRDKTNTSLKWLNPQSLSDAVKLLKALFQYFVLKIGGPLASNYGESVAFIRSDDPTLFPSALYPTTLVDSTSAKDSPDLELFTTPLGYKEHGAFIVDVHTYMLHVYLLRPTSYGSVLLKSASPWAQPSVNPNYIQTSEDLEKLLRGVRLLLKIAQTSPLADVLDASFKREDFDHDLHLKSDEEIKALIRKRVETVYHPTTTCRMGPKEDGAVVDARLSVYGVKGLRVCDASVFPWIISGHTTGACYAVAEKLSDDIKAQFHSSHKEI